MLRCFDSLSNRKLSNRSLSRSPNLRRPESPRHSALPRPDSAPLPYALKMFCKIVQLGSGDSIASLSSFPRRDLPGDNAAEARKMRIAASTPVWKGGTGRANPVQTALWSRLPRPVPACHTQSPLKPARPHRTSGQSPHTELCFANLGTVLDASTGSTKRP